MYLAVWKKKRLLCSNYHVLFCFIMNETFYISEFTILYRKCTDSTERIYAYG